MQVFRVVVVGQAQLSYGVQKDDRLFLALVCCFVGFFFFFLPSQLCHLVDDLQVMHRSTHTTVSSTKEVERAALCPVQAHRVSLGGKCPDVWRNAELNWHTRLMFKPGSKLV